MVRAFNSILVCVLVVGCAQDLSSVEDGALTSGGSERDTETRVANKNSALVIDAPSVCTVPCLVSVKGMSGEITSGVQYSANGEVVGTSVHWWSDYDFMLPVNLVGPVSLKAEVLSPYGGIIASATSTIVVSSSNDVETEALMQLTNEAQCDNPCELTVAVSGPVTEVEFYADTYYLGMATQLDGFSISYQFSQPGRRSLTARAYNADGRIIAEDTQQIQIVAPATSQTTTSSSSAGGLPNVPYFFQYDNRRFPGSSCQNTSIAMVLAYLGWRGNPDDITSAYGKYMAQEPAGLARLFNIYGQNMGASMRLLPNINGSIAGLKSELDRGHPVIIHGYFTRPGHVVVVLGYDDNGYYVNDPAGAWSQVFKGGYSSGGSGRNTYYRRGAFEAAVATLDGYSPLPLWYHSLR